MTTPRRARVDQWTAAEHVIRAAVDAVEAMPPDERLTDAVVLLGLAKESVADYVDGINKRRWARVVDVDADVTDDAREAAMFDQMQERARPEENRSCK